MLKNNIVDKLSMTTNQEKCPLQRRGGLMIMPIH